MDQRNANENRRVPTEEEIARLEAEAAAALGRGERPQGRAGLPDPQSKALDSESGTAEPAQPDFVPYVDDVPEPESELADDDDDDEYIPSEWERRIDALSPEQWRRWQIGGGAVVGAAAIASLFLFGEELSTYGLVVAALLALLLPRYLERAWRRKLTTARYAMVAAMVIGLAIMAAVMLARNRG